MTLLRLVRFPNLLVVALTQWLVAEWVLGKAYEQQSVKAVLVGEELWLLILATVCLTAAGYVLNDLLDYSIDMINRPERVIVGKRITSGTVRWIAACFFFVGFGFSLLLAFKKQELEWLWLYPGFGILLGMYPPYLKTKPFLGNLFIAFCCAGTAGLVWLAERTAWQQLDTAAAKQVTSILVLFMAYAFLATWIREIVKDFEDYEGDAYLGRITVPVYLGQKKGKQLVLGLTVLLALALLSGGIPWQSSSTQAPVIVAIVVLILLLLYLTLQFFKAREARHYHRLSQYWKLFLLGGLILLFLYQI
jgi:4-hydroxybenzoate polyprenyltransferase